MIFSQSARNCLNLSWVLYKNGISFMRHSLNHITYYTSRDFFVFGNSSVSKIVIAEGQKNKWFDEKLDIHQEMNVDNRNDEHLFETFCEVYFSFKYVLFCISKWISLSNVLRISQFTLILFIICIICIICICSQIVFKLVRSQNMMQMRIFLVLCGRHFALYANFRFAIAQIYKNWSRLCIFNLVSLMVITSMFIVHFYIVQKILILLFIFSFFIS